MNFPQEQFGNCCILGIKFLMRVIFQKLNEKPDLSEDTRNEVNAALELLEKLTKPDKLDVEGLSSVFYSNPNNDNNLLDTTILLGYNFRSVRIGC